MCACVIYYYVTHGTFRTHSTNKSQVSIVKSYTDSKGLKLCSENCGVVIAVLSYQRLLEVDGVCYWTHCLLQAFSSAALYQLSFMGQSCGHSISPQFSNWNTFQSDLGKKMLELPKSTANNIPLLMNGDNSLGPQAFKSIAVNDLESASVFRAPIHIQSHFFCAKLKWTCTHYIASRRRSRNLTAPTYLAMPIDTPPNFLYLKLLWLMIGQSSEMKPLIEGQMAQNQLRQFFKSCTRQHSPINCVLPVIVHLKLLRTLYLVCEHFLQCHTDLDMQARSICRLSTFARLPS